jgi:hypothetical protein
VVAIFSGLRNARCRPSIRLDQIFAASRKALALSHAGLAAIVRHFLRTLNPRHNPTQETLNRLLKPFRLKLSLTPIAQP